VEDTVKIQDAGCAEKLSFTQPVHKIAAFITPESSLPFYKIP
jgi:hypothetical protein